MNRKNVFDFALDSSKEDVTKLPGDDLEFVK